MATTPDQLSRALTTEGFPTPSAQFLTSILSSNRSPLPGLLATAKHRLLASDFTSSSVLDPSTPSFPANISSRETREQKLPLAIPVQVLGVEDLSKSRWEQIEAIEAKERGEATKGREIIRVVAEDANDGGQGTSNANRNQGQNSGQHRLVLQDVKGMRVYALELKPVREVGLGMSIGMKVVLKPGTIVARGVVLLEPAT